METVLDRLKSKYYKANEVIYNGQGEMPYMGIIFVGSVEYTEFGEKVTKGKNDINMSQACYKAKHPPIIAKQ